MTKECRFEYPVRLRAEHCDPNRKLRLQSLLHFSQEMCIHHTELLGMGRKMTLDKGFLWIINKERFEITRLPEYDEEITLVTYPGEMLHYFFPRYFRILDKSGTVIVKGSILWSLIDKKTRQLIDPIEHGIHIQGQEKPDQLPLMFSTRHPDLQARDTITATFDRCDLNGHLNNASYLDIALEHMPLAVLKEKAIHTIDMSFAKEIPLGESFELTYGSSDNAYYFTSDDFFIRMTYGD